MNISDITDPATDDRIKEALRDADSKGKLGVVAAIAGIAGGTDELRKIMNTEGELRIIDRGVLVAYLSAASGRPPEQMMTALIRGGPNMGMFDYVRFECDCPVCGKTLNEFQSKSGPCDLRSIKPTKLENFYAFCNKCGSMIVFNKPWDKKKWTRSVKKKGQDGGQQDYDLEEKFSKSQIKQSTTEKRMRDD